MTATPTIDVSSTPGIPFSRLLRVELRKSADTRAGRWLIGVTVGLALAAEVIFLIVAATHDDVEARYGDFVAVSAFVSSVLLPVLGIMLVTSEWSQRTGVTDLTPPPRRGRGGAAPEAPPAGWGTGWAAGRGGRGAGGPPLPAGPAREGDGAAKDAPGRGSSVKVVIAV